MEWEGPGKQGEGIAGGRGGSWRRKGHGKVEKVKRRGEGRAAKGAHYNLSHFGVSQPTLEELTFGPLCPQLQLLEKIHMQTFTYFTSHIHSFTTFRPHT